MISVLNLEYKIYQIEEIRVLIRAPPNLEVHDYLFKRKAKDDMMLSNWIENRLIHCIGSLHFSIFDPRCFEPNKHTCTLGNLRKAMEQK